MQFSTATDLVVGFKGPVCIFGAGSRQKRFTDSSIYLPLLDAAARWKTPHSPQGIRRSLASTYGEKTADRAIDFLISERHVTRTIDPVQHDRYHRHLLYFNALDDEPTKVQHKLSQSTVAILGCGGIGNHVGAHLAAAGIGSMLLIDDDIVELSNLTRQSLFTEADIGRQKAPSLANRLRHLNSEIKIETIEDRMQVGHIPKGLFAADLIVLSADESADLIHFCNAQFVANGLPYINVGYVGDIATFGPFYIPGKTGCFACGNLITQESSIPFDARDFVEQINQGAKAPSFGPVNGIAAAYAALDAIRFLGKLGEPLAANQRVGIHTTSLRIQFQECQRHNGCEVCAAA
jgi:molybdopterin/thiamine biosynthesis adenylyltransferase